jgi:hypothetical protein
VADVRQLGARGFQPVMRLDEGLAAVTAWYKVRTRQA